MPTLVELGSGEEPVQVRDGASLVGLLEGRPEPDRMVFSELHAEGVHTTCVMARQGNLKYIHTTGFAPQLYDLARDPNEWENLAGAASYADDEARMAQLVAEEFDLEAIERDVMAKPGPAPDREAGQRCHRRAAVGLPTSARCDSAVLAQKLTVADR